MLNGMWIDDDVAATHIDEAQEDARALGTPFTVVVREGRSPAVEDAARERGFEATDRIPGMAVAREGLRDPGLHEHVEVIRVETADGLAQALAVGAAGFGISPDLVASVYSLEVAALDGLRYYLARSDGRDVATAAGFTTEDAVAIFNVATAPDVRGRGYGSAVTAAAIRDGFEAGAEFAALQSSALGESVYRGLGFLEIETYLPYTISDNS
jgi:ribosomal protein S18 acetylase RimI-like enzyme